MDNHLLSAAVGISSPAPADPPSVMFLKDHQMPESEAPHDVAELRKGLEFVLGRRLTEKELQLLADKAAFEQLQFHVEKTLRKVAGWFQKK
jgi:hypothetical protein